MAVRRRFELVVVPVPGLVAGRRRVVRSPSSSWSSARSPSGRPSRARRASGRPRPAAAGAPRGVRPRGLRQPRGVPQGRPLRRRHPADVRRRRGDVREQRDRGRRGLRATRAVAHPAGHAARGPRGPHRWPSSAGWRSWRSWCWSRSWRPTPPSGWRSPTRAIVATVALCTLLGALYAGLAIAVAGVVGRPGPVLAVGLGLALVGLPRRRPVPAQRRPRRVGVALAVGLGARRRPALPSHRARPLRRPRRARRPPCSSSASSRSRGGTSARPEPRSA